MVNIKINNIFSEINENCNFIIVTFYTIDNGYKKYFDKLLESIKKFNLNYYAYELIRGDNKWEFITRLKAEYLLQVMNKYPDKKIIWLDSDAVILKYPTLFLEISKDIGVFYTSQNEVLSGTLFFNNTEKSKEILEEWKLESKKMDSNINITNYEDCLDQKILEKVLKNHDKDNIFILPKEYISIFDRDKKNIVIIHYNASRELKRYIPYFFHPLRRFSFKPKYYIKYYFKKYYYILFVVMFLYIYIYNGKL